MEANEHISGTVMPFGPEVMAFMNTLGEFVIVFDDDVPIRKRKFIDERTLRLKAGFAPMFDTPFWR